MTTRPTDETIRLRISEIEDDPRFQSGRKHPATIDINAPLALVQIALENEWRALRWVLGEL